LVAVVQLLQTVLIQVLDLLSHRLAAAEARQAEVLAGQEDLAGEVQMDHRLALALLAKAITAAWLEI
jgi:hypothetical protein